MAQEIWLFRHGQTEWSQTGQHTGRTDIPLTPRGQEQARALQTLVAGQHFDLVLCSPLQRARETARLAGLVEAAVCPQLAEWDYGSLEGRTSAEIHQDYPNWTIWDGPIPGGEDIQTVAARAQEVLLQCPQGKTALVAHGHILRVLAACWLRLAPTEGRLLALSTGSLSVLGWEHETRVVSGWNHVPGL